MIALSSHPEEVHVCWVFAATGCARDHEHDLPRLTSEMVDGPVGNIFRGSDGIYVCRDNDSAMTLARSFGMDGPDPEARTIRAG
jgi:hypothetical protein